MRKCASGSFLYRMSAFLYFACILKDTEGLSEKERELKTLKEQFHDDFPVGPLIGKCCTMDQVHVANPSKFLS